MDKRAATTLIVALLLAGCAAMTPPPRFTAASPADPAAPEAATPPAAAVLAGEPEALAPATSGDTEKPAMSHGGHPMPAEPAGTHHHEGHGAVAPADVSPAEPVYSCPAHPEVKTASPGACPRCGKELVTRESGEFKP